MLPHFYDMTAIAVLADKNIGPFTILVNEWFFNQNRSFYAGYTHCQVTELVYG